jgi:hypothetical protein
MLRPECGRRPIQKFRSKKQMQKARDQFPGAGSIVAANSCEDDNVPVICPTWQDLRSVSMNRQSSDLTCLSHLFSVIRLSREWVASCPKRLRLLR